MMNTCTTKITY